MDFVISHASYCLHPAHCSLFTTGYRSEEWLPRSSNGEVVQTGLESSHLWLKSGDEWLTGTVPAAAGADRKAADAASARAGGPRLRSEAWTGSWWSMNLVPGFGGLGTEIRCPG